MVIVRVAEADGSAVSTTNHALMTSFIEDSYLDSTSGNEGDTNGGDANFTIRKTGASTASIYPRGPTPPPAPSIMCGCGCFLNLRVVAQAQNT